MDNHNLSLRDNKKILLFEMFQTSTKVNRRKKNPSNKLLQTSQETTTLDQIDGWSDRQIDQPKDLKRFKKWT